MKHVRLYENFDENDSNFINEEEMSIYNKILDYLIEMGFDFYDGEEDFRNKFIEVMTTPNLSGEEKTESLCGFLDEKWGLYERYTNVYKFVKMLFDE